MRSPRASCATIRFSSSCSSGGMIRVIDWPIDLDRRVAEDPRRGGVPGGDPTVERLADDRIVRGRHNGGQPRQLDLGPVSFGDVHQQVDGADQAAGRVPQRRRIGKEIDARAVGFFGDGLDPADGPALPKRLRHRALVMRHGPSVGPEQTPRPAPSIASELGAMAPQIGGGLVEEGDAAFGVGRIDGDRQGLEQLRAGGHDAFTPILDSVPCRFSPAGRPASDRALIICGRARPGSAR